MNENMRNTFSSNGAIEKFDINLVQKDEELLFISYNLKYPITKKRDKPLKGFLS
jgi:hypothetical protein